MNIKINDITFFGDSEDYNFLYDSARAINGIPGLTCEIGLRLGCGTSAIVAGLMSNNDFRHHIGIDPYGASTEVSSKINATPNIYRNEFLIKIFSLCQTTKAFDFLFFQLEDSEFFSKFHDGVPIYTDKKEIINQYALVHFDGPHDYESVLKEFQFFNFRVPIGGRLIFDDIHSYDHDKLESVYIIPNQFKTVSKSSRRALYVKS